MLTSSTSRVLQRAALRQTRAAVGRRYASGHGEHYNEPSGWMFGEKVRIWTLPVGVSALATRASIPMVQVLLQKKYFG